MPNIIEQQDLLKGLPDDRLATLMQNPTGDIPPFLVAAEAQRRQSIRAQFSGGPEESVVDTLTKQMANVPQNIQAPAQQPPQMPPPQQGGVADLQQGMRDGGMVQRYQDGSLVTPTFRGRAGGGGYYPGEQPQGDFVTDVYNYVTGVSAPYFDRLRRFGINPTPEQIKTIQEESAAGSESEPYRYGMTADERRMMQKAPVPTAAPAEQPRDPNAGQDDTSYENKLSAREAKLRERQEELFGDTELSSWEKAQKWFAAAQAAVQPGQTNAQAAINALAALGGGFAEEKSAQRQAESEKEKAMLQWDLARYEADRAAAASAASDALQYKRDIDKLKLQDELTGKREINKLQTLSPNSAIDGINAQMKILGDELADPSLDEATRKAKQAQLDSLSLMLAQIMNKSGYSVGSVPTIEEMRRLAAGQ